MNLNELFEKRIFTDLSPTTARSDCDRSAGGCGKLAPLLKSWFFRLLLKDSNKVLMMNKICLELADQERQELLVQYLYYWDRDEYSSKGGQLLLLLWDYLDTKLGQYWAGGKGKISVPTKRKALWCKEWFTWSSTLWIETINYYFREYSSRRLEILL